MGTHTVKQGECIFSIAATYQVPWSVIWNDPANGELRQARKRPNILFPDDQVYIPQRDGKPQAASSDEKHRFKRTQPRTCIRLKLIYDGEPLGQRDYVLSIGDQRIEGQTSPAGELEELVDATAVEATLEVAGRNERYRLKIGYLDPIDTTAGLQARLNNLGYDAGPVDDDWGKLTRGGMQGFQGRAGLTVSQRPDADTLARLETEHGS